MAPRPTAERPPKGLDSYWTHVWNHALQLMKDQGIWGWELKPLLDEYVFALRGAQATRDGFEWLRSLEAFAEAHPDDMPEISWTILGRVAGGLPTQWDRHVKRAAALADQLALTERGRKAVGLGDEDGGEALDPFDALDELAEKRRSRSA